MADLNENNVDHDQKYQSLTDSSAENDRKLNKFERQKLNKKLIARQNNNIKKKINKGIQEYINAKDQPTNKCKQQNLSEEEKQIINIKNQIELINQNRILSQLTDEQKPVQELGTRNTEIVANNSSMKYQALMDDVVITLFSKIGDATTTHKIIVEVPHSFINSLKVFLIAHGNITDTTYKILVNYALRLLRDFDITSHQQLQIMQYIPRHVYDEHYKYQNFINNTTFNHSNGITKQQLETQLSDLSEVHYDDTIYYPTLRFIIIILGIIFFFGSITNVKADLNSDIKYYKAVIDFDQSIGYETPLNFKTELLKLENNQLRLEIQSTKNQIKKISSDIEGINTATSFIIQVVDASVFGMAVFIIIMSFIKYPNFSHIIISIIVLFVLFMEGDETIMTMVSAHSTSTTYAQKTSYYTTANLKEGSQIRLPYDYNVKAYRNPTSQQVYGIDNEYKPISYANNIDNELSALTTRVCVATPIIDKAEMAKFIKWVKTNSRKLFRFKKVKPVKFTSYIKRSNASGAMKRRLIVRQAELVAEGFRFDKQISKYLADKLTTRDMFVKIENLLYESPLGEKEKAPRAIQGASLDFIIIMGPYFMALQDEIKKQWNVKNFVCYSSGISSKKLAMYLMFGGEFWEDDVSCWDSSVCTELLELEIWISKRFGANVLIQQLMRANNQTHGWTLHGIYYKVPGGRKSGDPYTSLFNSVLNGLLHLYIISEYTGKGINWVKNNVRMLVAGDDNAMNILFKFYIPFKEIMYKLGFNAEAYYREHIEDVEFCSSRIYDLGDNNYTFGPMPGKVLSKFGILNSPPANIHPFQLLKGICLGLLPQVSFIPPIKSVITHFMNICSDYKAYYNNETKQFIKRCDWHMNFDDNKVYSEPTAGVWVDLQLQYGWTPELNDELEKDLSKHVSGKIQSKAYNFLCDRDTAAPSLCYTQSKQKSLLLLTLLSICLLFSPVLGTETHLFEPNGANNTYLTHISQYVQTGGTPGSHIIPRGITNKMNKIQNKTKKTQKGASKKITITQVKATPKHIKPASKNRHIASGIRGNGDYSAEGIGSGLGSWLGGMAGRLFKSVTGIGDYSVADTRTSKGGGNGPPMFNGKGAPTLEHREYIGDVFSSENFSITSYPLNPGLSQTFPWLAQNALNFEEYKLLGCIFEYKAMSANALNSIDTALGTVILATEYDVESQGFTSKSQMENHMFASSAPPSTCQLHAIECNKKLNPLNVQFTRNGPVPTGADARMYDLGTFNIATQGMQSAGVNIGELWVTYKVQLLKPSLPLTGAGTLGARLEATAAPTSTSGILTPLYTSPSSLLPGSNIEGLTVAGNSIFFPDNITSGTYQIVYNTYTTTSITFFIPSITTTINCTPLALYPSSSGLNTATIYSTTAQGGMFSTLQLTVTVTGAGAVVGFGAWTGFPTSGSCFASLVVSSLPPTLLTLRCSKAYQQFNTRIEELENKLQHLLSLSDNPHNIQVIEEGDVKEDLSKSTIDFLATDSRSLIDYIRNKKSVNK